VDPAVAEYLSMGRPVCEFLLFYFYFYFRTYGQLY
jgi:hypothetical protein